MIILDGKDRFWVGTQASVLNADDRLKDWAEKFVRKDRDLKWILGNFVESENSNTNGHIFPLKDLKQDSIFSIQDKPLNMLHHGNYIVGHYVAAEFRNPQSIVASGEPQNVYVEALSAFYHRFFPDEYQLVEKAHKEGNLYFSMECECDSVTCAADDGCGETFTFDGPMSDSYCDHLQKPRSKKRLNKPWFNAGALIFPPIRPGWSEADITELSAFMQKNPDEVEKLYAGLEKETPHLDPKAWEELMYQVILTSKSLA